MSPPYYWVTAQVISTDNGNFQETYDYDGDGLIKMIQYVQKDGLLLDISFTRHQSGLIKEAEWHYMPPDTNITIVQKELYTYEGKNLKDFYVTN